jgi:hypothetical protein
MYLHYWVYLNLVSSAPSIILPYPFPPTPHFSTAFNTYCCILYLCRCNVFWYCWTIIPFSFPSFPRFRGVAPLLQTCCTYKCVYDCVWFCIYVNLLDLPSTYVFLNLATSLNIMSSNCIHLPSHHMISFFLISLWFFETGSFCVARRLVWNLWSFFLHHPSTGIIGVCSSLFSLKY